MAKTLKHAAAQRRAAISDSLANAFPNSRADGWANMANGLNIEGQDPRTMTEYRPSPRLVEPMLDAMYSGDGFVRKIVDLPANEMTRRGFEIIGDDDGAVVSHFESRKLMKSLRTMIKWSRLFGGAVAVLGAEDGNADLTKPLNVNGIRSLNFIHVFDRFRVTWAPGDIYRDPRSPKYGKPSKYLISPITGNPFQIHESRVLVMEGLEVSDTVRELNQGWGDSVVQACYEQVRQLGTMFLGVESIVDDFVTAVFTVEGLFKAMMNGQEDKIRERMRQMKMSRHLLNAILLDKGGEAFQKQTSSVAGLGELVDRSMYAVSGVSNIPQTILFGRSAAGQNATGEGDRIAFYDFCEGEQEAQLLPVLETLVRLIMLSKDGPTKGKELQDWQIKFKPLYRPTDMEAATLRDKVADTDKKYHDMQVVDAEEIRASRWQGGRYSAEMVLDDDLYAEGKEADDDEAAAALEKKANAVKPPAGDRGR